MNGSGLVMFRLDQRVAVKRHDDRRVQYRHGIVSRINQDGSAIMKLDGPEEPPEAEVWPDDCEPE